MKTLKKIRMAEKEKRKKECKSEKIEER